MIIRNFYLLLFLNFQACSFFKHTDEKQVRKDVLNYLEKTYNQKFEIAEYDWDCNEGNGCPDAHILKCYPLNNPEINFLVNVYYGKSLEVHDEYKYELLNFDAKQDLGKIIKSQFSSFEIKTNIHAQNNQLDNYQINQLNFEKIIENYPNNIYTSIYIYLLENREENRKRYLNLVRKVLARYGSLPVKDLTLEIYFYNENAYRNLSSKEIHKIFDSDNVILKDFKNCKKEWDMQFKNKDLKNLDSLLTHLENSIHEINFEKIN